MFLVLTYQTDDEERQSLRQRKQSRTEDSRAVGGGEGSIQAPRILLKAIIFTSQALDGPDGAGSLASQLSGVFVSDLVGLILEDDDTETDVAGGDDEGDTS